MPKVSIIKCSSYDEARVEAAVKKAVDALGGFGKFVKKGQNVLLKANLLNAKKPEDAITTHPEILKAIARLCKKQGAKVFVGDSPAILDFKKVGKKSQVTKACKDCGVKLIELSEPVEKKSEKGYAAKKLFVSKKLEEFDVIINVPKLKTHVFTGFTGAVKNCYGCVPKRIKGDYHLTYSTPDSFSKMLLDLHGIIKPNISIMDAVVGMDGEGPSAGNPKEIGLVLASESSHALDFTALKVVGINPEKIPTIYWARKLKLEDFERVQVLGDFEAKDFPIVKGFKPSKAFSIGLSKLRFFSKIFKPLFDKKPSLLKKKCISCGKCLESCPADAVSFNYSRKPEFNYKECIRCFCCQEVCPEKAIEAKPGIALKFLRKIKGN